MSERIFLRIKLPRFVGQVILLLARRLHKAKARAE